MSSPGQAPTEAVSGAGVAPGDERNPASKRGAGAMALLTRLRFTAALTAALLLVGVATGTAWRPLAEDPLLAQVGFGVPSLEQGRWWTLATGSFFALTPLGLAVLLAFVVIGVGLCEWTRGTRTAAAVTSVLQLVGVLGGIGLAWALSLTGWPWAVTVAGELDAGFSAGALGAAVVAAASLRQPWRWRLQLAVFAIVLTSLVFLGYLADLIHVVAILVALPIGARVAGQPLRLRWPSLTRVEVRKLAAAFFVLAAVLTVAGTMVSRSGPFGPFGGGSADPAIWIGAALDLVIAAGLLRGRRSWWRLAVVLVTLEVLLSGVALVLVIALELAAELPVVLLNLVLSCLQLGVLWIGRAAFINPGRKGRRRLDASHIGGLPTDADRERATELLAAVGSANHLSWITTWPANSWWLPAGGSRAVAYQEHAGVAIGLCDPICPPAELAQTADAFVVAAGDAGLIPCFFSSSAAVRSWALGRGWRALTVAQEAVIDLPPLEFRGKKWQDVRTALNQAPKHGVEYRRFRLLDAPRSVRSQLTAISQEWVGEKDLPEMGFTLGGLEEAADPRVWVSVAIDAENTVHGFTSWLPAYTAGGTVAGWTLDAMRRSPDGFRYTMEFLIASACLEFKAEGCEFVSLSGAPLAGTSDAEQSDPLAAVATRLAATVEPYYGFGTLERFKAKFMPRHEPLYLLAADEAAMARAGVAVGRAYLAQASPSQLIGLLRPDR